ncbi:alpha-amylase family glycosyl hydrolase [Candidatus Mycoplasma mahonii]|uniref:alpha-amylase family glycosyl hydrolase n=1 Tax=Candidatus Mycoplasma mahonii TaxID=3004105 RepID=UPI0026F30FC4|nr:alpha-amylase family glycosyl hydrolase [Candidatus Mycoplasma mahonii]WKX02795.1 alpha-amylase family glycosyl hydrolase [Candidatus Mycoplasma mahonii]
MAIRKKQIFYEVNPRYFSDSSGDGIGDLKGLSNKLDYFNYLGINSIILQNILSLNSDDLVQNYVQVAKDLGNIDDLKEVISLAKEKGIKILIEMPIGYIKDSHKWFKNANEDVGSEFSQVIDFMPKDDTKNISFKYSEKQKAYYAIDDKTKEIPLNWKNEQVNNQFGKVLRFWTDLGINGFVFKDFEFITDIEKNEKMSDDTLKELRKFYRAIKEMNDGTIVIGKSDILGLDGSKFTNGATQVFDYFMPTEISMIGTNPKYGADFIGTFKASKLANKMNKALKNKHNIITFGNENIGRINERWGNKGQFSDESAKAIGMLLLLHPASSSIYYGDEIGSLNIGLTHLDDFQDVTIAERMHRLLSERIKEKHFMDAQVLQNPINARSLMSWSDEKNGGFSLSEKTVTPVSYNYKEINVKNQYNNTKSTLSFFKELIRISSTPDYKNIIENGEFKISSWIPGVIKVSATYKEKGVFFYVNLTNKVKLIIRPKSGKVVLSTKSHKTYTELPKSLDAYEGILISKKTDIAILAKQEDYEIAKDKKKEEEAIAVTNEANRLVIEQAKLDEANEKLLIKKSKDQEIRNDEARIAREEIQKSKINEQKKLKSEKIEQFEIKKKEAEAEKTRLLQLEEKSKWREQKMIEREKRSKLKDAEKTRQLEIKQARRLEKEAEAEKTRLFKIEEKEKAREESMLERAEKLKNKSEKTRELNIRNGEKDNKKETLETNQQITERSESENDWNMSEIDDLRLKNIDNNFEDHNQKRDHHDDQKLKNTLELSRVERKVAKEILKNKKKFSIMEEEILETDRTTLTEDDIAATTQINPDEFDDFEAFLSDEENKKKK